MSSFKALNDTLAGSAAGIVQVLVGQPLDTIKTRAQIAPSSVHPSALLFQTALKGACAAM